MEKPTVIIIVLITLLIGLGLGYVLAQTQNNQTTQTPNSAENAPQGSIHNMPVPAGVSAARTQLSQEAGVEEGQILIVTAFEKEWSDSCLGLGGAAESCLMVITPGYEVTMQAGGKTYVYRTNADGTAVRAQP